MVMPDTVSTLCRGGAAVGMEQPPTPQIAEPSAAIFASLCLPQVASDVHKLAFYESEGVNAVIAQERTSSKVWSTYVNLLPRKA